MTLPSPSHLSARKKPRQARAVATLEAIFDATIQVLVTEGPQRLTTTRVAERAGVSVGSMYQYFPHKQALFYALNERYLVMLADRVVEVCHSRHGGQIAQMVTALVTVYWEAKMAQPEVTRALYRSVVELDNQSLIQAFIQRVDQAAREMFASASDATFINLNIVVLTLLTTIFGAVRSAFERDLTAEDARAVHDQLIVMCKAYLHACQR
ncbi:TetR/AcrR family transcriptional regulator [Erwinia oleae]|uniref:TetR/AcrR family transcriptional regulator n=1 Tax=Erwinia oleae TaxID=796334 RepID=UPI000555F92F|nr:TetR/AcrR family transcriptional regulator [Erwinia oleae]